MNSFWNNYFQTDLIASACGIGSSVPEERGWQAFIDDLNDDETVQIFGCLIQRFGYPNFSDESHDGIKSQVFSYLSKLEDEFSDWLCNPNEVVDYYLAARHANLNNVTENSFWLKSHQQIWEFRGHKTAYSPPQGIRVLLLVETSVESLLSGRIGPSLAIFFKDINEQSIETGELIDYIEKGCEFLGKSASELLGESFFEFKKIKKHTQKAIHEKVGTKAAGSSYETRSLYIGYSYSNTSTSAKKSCPGCGSHQACYCK